MIPRNLRHRLEKASKLLVIVQKHSPEVSCMINAERGQDGYLILDFSKSENSGNRMKSLGSDFERRGYAFTEKRNAWLGQTTYTGRAVDKPTILMTCPIQQDRLAINESTTETSFRFSEAASDT